MADRLARSIFLHVFHIPTLKVAVPLRKSLPLCVWIRLFLPRAISVTTPSSNVGPHPACSPLSLTSSSQSRPCKTRLRACREIGTRVEVNSKHKALYLNSTGSLDTNTHSGSISRVAVGHRLALCIIRVVALPSTKA